MVLQVVLSTYIFTSPMKTLFFTFSFSVPTTVNLMMMIIRLNFFDVLLIVHLSIILATEQLNAHILKRREENQLGATECFIAIIICSTCFGHSYAHHQELKTILVLLPHVVCNALVAGGRRSGAGQ